MKGAGAEVRGMRIGGEMNTRAAGDFVAKCAEASVRAGAVTKRLGEGAAEGFVRLVAGGEGGIDNAAARLGLQRGGGALQTDAADEAGDRFPDHPGKETVEMIGREAGNSGELFEDEWLIEVGLNMIQHAQEALFVVVEGARVHG